MSYTINYYLVYKVNILTTSPRLPIDDKLQTISFMHLTKTRSAHRWRGRAYNCNERSAKNRYGSLNSPNGVKVFP